MKTELIKISRCDDLKQRLISAAEVIKSGGLVIFPTETVYGLGGNALSSLASKKIYEAKGRPQDNPLIIHIADPIDAERYTFTNELYNSLAKRFMPGPLTVILPAKECIPMETRASLPTVAVRCPSHPVARMLIKLSGTPIAAPSANLSGSPSPTKARHVIDDMMGRVDVIIAADDSEIGLESTIVKIESDNSLTLLRPGKITVDELREVCSEVRIAEAVTNQIKEGETVLSPGMKYRHYAPKAPVVLLDGDSTKIADYIANSSKDKKLAAICYKEDVDLIKEKAPSVLIYEFGEKKDEETQAHLLFDILRDADKEDFDVIYAPLPRREGVGLALYNRMIRAAAYNIIKL
ncbi:MAG: threonylcarbamoyl-AMP synthase [Ruminococcaceae bacterium]|nr:threonylcarbamoyl-AMP synthase [Oscillospiraceae bacterium]